MRHRQKPGADCFLALAYHYQQLQALAFEEDFDPAEMADLDRTLPKHHGMHKAAGDFMKEWNMEVDEDERGVAVAKGSSKRAAVDVSLILLYLAVLRWPAMHENKRPAADHAGGRRRSSGRGRALEAESAGQGMSRPPCQQLPSVVTIHIRVARS